MFFLLTLCLNAVHRVLATVLSCHYDQLECVCMRLTEQFSCSRLDRALGHAIILNQ